MYMTDHSYDLNFKDCIHFNGIDYCEPQLMFEDQDVLNRPCDCVTSDDFKTENAKEIVDFLLKQTEERAAAGFAANQFGIPARIITFNYSYERAEKFTNLLFQYKLIDEDKKNETLNAINTEESSNLSDDLINFGPYLASYSYMINPIILEKKGSVLQWREACFSDLYNINYNRDNPAKHIVERNLNITVQYQDLEQNTHIITAKDFLACVIQHEIDHINGITIMHGEIADKDLIWKIIE